MFDRLRLLFAKGAQGVCGGAEEIGVGFQQWCVAGSQARQEDRVRSVASGLVWLLLLRYTTKSPIAQEKQRGYFP